MGSSSRASAIEWHITLAALAAPLIQAMKTDAFQSPYLCTDATGVLVQRRSAAKTAISGCW
jgi:hypothetical protein